MQGAAGTGKTLMGMEFIYRGITEHNENGMIVVFETSPDKVIRDAGQFGWDFEELERQNKLKIVFTSRAGTGIKSELRSPDSLLLEIAGGNRRPAHLHRRYRAVAPGAAAQSAGRPAGLQARKLTASSYSNCWKQCIAKI